MRYPGTISLSSDTFQRLLQDIITSLSLSGFQEIVVVGDSGGSQDDIVRAVTQRNPENTNNARVRYLTQFYNYDGVRDFLRERGINETPEKFHEDLAFTLQLLAIDPSAVRYDQRLAVGAKSLGGVSLEDRDRVVALGREILEWRARLIADAIRAK
jgi:creatinine amidohydrolase/Fe(II)-dependent formamide hydrolase-like protein